MSDPTPHLTAKTPWSQHTANLSILRIRESPDPIFHLMLARASTHRPPPLAFIGKIQAPSINSSSDPASFFMAPESSARQATLVFSVYHGTRLYAGESYNQMTLLPGGLYRIISDVHTVGVVRIFKNYHLAETSLGRLDSDGDMIPEDFYSDTLDNGDASSLSSHFDASRRRATLKNGQVLVTPPKTQDSLSFLFEMSRELTGSSYHSVSIVNGIVLQNYTIQLLGEETIHTPMGREVALHWSLVRAPAEPGFEIWLSKKNLNLPIRIQIIKPGGGVETEADIRTIRISNLPEDFPFGSISPYILDAVR